MGLLNLEWGFDSLQMRQQKLTSIYREEMKTKYIRAQYKFVVFPDSIQHRDCARKIFGPDILIHGAGFMSLFAEKGLINANCYGYSESLDVNSRHDDGKEILNRLGIENDKEVSYAKYVRSKNVVVVFSSELSHETVANAVLNNTAESAGLVKILMADGGKIKIQCCGSSESLGLSPNEKDKKYIASLFQLENYEII